MTQTLYSNVCEEKQQNYHQTPQHGQINTISSQNHSSELL